MNFPDTNIWIYGFLSDQDFRKHLISKEITSRDDVLVSQQVVAEVCNALIRKGKVPESRIRKIISEFKENYHLFALDTENYIEASLLRERYNFSHWDSLLIVAALELGATIFYSEDMQDGLVVNGALTIRNPFK